MRFKRCSVVGLFGLPEENLCATHGKGRLLAGFYFYQVLALRQVTAVTTIH